MIRFFFIKKYKFWISKVSPIQTIAYIVTIPGPHATYATVMSSFSHAAILRARAMMPLTTVVVYFFISIESIRIWHRTQARMHTVTSLSRTRLCTLFRDQGVKMIEQGRKRLRKARRKVIERQCLWMQRERGEKKNAT
jgi:DUF1365 family protein